MPPLATVSPPSPLPPPEFVLSPPPGAPVVNRAAPTVPVVPAPLPPARAPSTSDVTGSIAPRISLQAAGLALMPAPAPASASPAATADRLPAAIGGATLIAAATAGDPAAAYEVATRFAEGHRVPQSFAQAAVWYERAAKGSLAPAQFRLAALYEKGDGVAKDLNEARRLYLAAAEKGNVNAMHNIGVLYAEGIDGKPDFKNAAQWFRKSAMYGVGDSQYNLAILYVRGLGLDPNMAEAYRWFALAANSGDPDAAKKRDEVAARIDAKTLAIARQAVAGFVAEHEPEDAASVKSPPGGWDQAQPAKRKPRPSAQARSKTERT